MAFEFVYPYKDTRKKLQLNFFSSSDSIWHLWRNQSNCLRTTYFNIEERSTNSLIWVSNVNMCVTLEKGRVGERGEEDGWLTLWWMLASCLGVADRPAGLAAGHRWMSRPTVVEQNDGDDAAEGWMSRWGKLLAARLLSRLPLDRRRSPSRWALDLFWWPASALYLASTVAHTPTRSERWAMQCHRRSPLCRKRNKKSCLMS